MNYGCKCGRIVHDNKTPSDGFFVLSGGEYDELVSYGKPARVIWKMFFCDCNRLVLIQPGNGIAEWYRKEKP